MSWKVTCEIKSAANGSKVQYALRLNILKPTKTTKRKTLQISITHPTLLEAGWKIGDRVVLLHDEQRKLFALERNPCGYLIQNNSSHDHSGEPNGRIVFPVRHKIQLRMTFEEGPRFLMMQELTFQKDEDLISFRFADQIWHRV